MVQLAVHGWDGTKKTWTADPVARTFGTVETPKDAGKPFVHNTLTLLGAKGSAPSSLPAGRYLVRIYLAPKGKLEGDFQSVWKAPEFVGQAELADPRWGTGYPNCTVFDSGQLGPKK